MAGSKPLHQVIFVWIFMIFVFRLNGFYAHRSIELEINEIDALPGYPLMKRNCDRVEKLHVLDFNVKYQNQLRRQQCYCEIRPPSETQTMDVIVEDPGAILGPRIEVPKSAWQFSDRVYIIMDDDKIQLKSCGATYTQSLPVNVRFGGEAGAMLSCSEFPSFISEEDMGCDKTTATDAQAHGQPPSTMRLMVGLLVAGCIIIVVLINLLVTLSLKFNFCKCGDKQDQVHMHHPPTSPTPHHRHYNPRRHALARQQTNLSHPYESILVEAEGDLDSLDRQIRAQASPIYGQEDDHFSVSSIHQNNVVSNYDNGGNRHHDSQLGVPTEYVPMNRSHVTLEGAESLDTIETNVDDLNDPVYPPSTYGELSPKLNASEVDEENEIEGEYSYTYSSREELNAMAQNQSRKCSLQSMESASGIVRAREMSRLLESRASFDSGYADRTALKRDSDGSQHKNGVANAFLDMPVTAPRPGASENRYYYNEMAENQSFENAKQLADKQTEPSDESQKTPGYLEIF